MGWQKMRIPGGEASESLPGDRGRYLLWLEPPEVEGEGHYVHFSWKRDSFCVRDYIRHLERRQGPGVTPVEVWKAASDRIPAKGELYVPVENFEFWSTKLRELTEKRKQGPVSNLWSRLSSKFAPQPKDVDQQPVEHREDYGGDVYRNFIQFWKRGEGFNVVERTVGCSARYQSVPLLWVYPTYFQVAPRGKGNEHHGEIVDLRHRHFPEMQLKGTISFTSEYFTWDRFQPFIIAIQDMVLRQGK